ncbi:MAG TPA: helix-turn-helix domain-containing protein [Terriglobales bacterium]|jgi:AraC-like DNA-binding protein
MGAIVESGTVIWVDLQTALATADLSAQVGLFCPIYKIRGVDKVADAIRALTPRAVLFECDDPSTELLEPVKRLASDFPASRFVMITRQHSESLAVWALRARLWDYLVKPVDLPYLLSCIDVLLDPETETASVNEQKNPHGEQRIIPRRDKDANFSNSLLDGDEHESKRLIAALSFVEANLAEKVTLETVATLCGLGRYQFSRAFKRAHGTTFREFVIIHRIHRAKQMLCFANVSITEVAFSVGFNDLSHFAQMFRRYVGVRPSEYSKGQKPR